METLRFPSQQFRAIQSPTGDSSRVGLFYTRADALPRELWNWREVNPREVKRGSAVYKQIEATLKNEPARFHERNRGITLIVDQMSYDEKRKQVLCSFADPKMQGVVDGAHTLHACLAAQEAPEDEEERDADPAYVFVKVFTGVEPSQIAEIAGGLNTSQQVDLKSLENLREHFEQLKRNLSGETYADQIAYKMNEDKPVDVRDVLYYLAVFDCSEYSDKKHPVALFGRKEGIVRRFAEQANERPDAGDSFAILISRAKEILQLRDLIEKKALERPVGKYKSGKNSRVRSESNRQNDLIFLQEKVNGRIPLGWLLPMLAGFRANVEWDRPKGTFSWKIPLPQLVDSCIGSLVDGIQDVHRAENSRPEYVGRNAIAWRMSYNAVSQAILEFELKQARAKNK